MNNNKNDKREDKVAVENKENMKIVFPVPQLPRQRKEKLHPILVTDFLPQQMYSVPSKSVMPHGDDSCRNDSYFFDFLDDIESILMDYVLIAIATREKCLSSEFTVSDVMKCKAELSQLDGDLEKLQVSAL